MLTQAVALTARRYPIPLSCPPPPNFREAGRVAWAQLEPQGPFGAKRSRPTTAAQAAGLRYERKVHGHLGALYLPYHLVAYGGGPWISFRQEDSGLLRWAQPDGFIIDWRRGLVIVVEVKLKHNTAAWWGLRALYEPVVGALFGSSWTVALCEVAGYYEPTVRWPEAHRMVRSPTDLKAGEIGVHLWRA